MLDEAVREATKKDYDNLMVAINGLEIQLWISSIAILVLFGAVVYFLKSDREWLRGVIDRHDKQLQAHENRWSHLDGKGDVTAAVASAITGMGDTIAEAINTSHGKKK